MRILGIDPALTRTGYGIIDADSLRKLKLLEAGIISTTPKQKLPDRLYKLYFALSEIIEEFKPEALVLEKLYSHYKHPTTAILMGHARGVVCFLCGQKKIPLIDVSATHIKKTITGNGHASKMQMQKMIEHMFKLDNKDYPSDVTDAIALAVGYFSANSNYS